MEIQIQIVLFKFLWLFDNAILSSSDHLKEPQSFKSTIYLGLVFTTAARIPYNPLYPLTPVKTFFLTYRRKKM